MTILDEVLIEEYDRCERIKKMYLNKIAVLPKGYLSQQKSKNKIYFYLKYQENGKVFRQRILDENVEALQKQIADRHRLQQGIQRCEIDQKKIRAALKVGGINVIEYLNLK